jgi:uncharacterized membrane protein YoaK (UPF0700 family)
MADGTAVEPVPMTATARSTTDRVMVPLLLALTFVTGLVDAFSFLLLGRVFVANMTGNVVFLAFAVTGAADFEVTYSLVAFPAFAAGAFVGGRLAARYVTRPLFLLAAAAGMEAVLFIAAAVLIAVVPAAGSLLPYLLVAVLAPAMGIQNAAARALAVPDLTTTVLTLTVTGIFADGRPAAGERSRYVRRIGSIVAMATGAMIGSLFVVGPGGYVAVIVASILLVGVAVTAAWRARAAMPSATGPSPAV